MRRLPASLLAASLISSLWLASAAPAAAWEAASGDPSYAAAPSRNAANDPPARIGRLASVQGTVWIYDPDRNEWVQAVRNRPVTSGDRIATDRDARAEIRTGSSVWRLDANTELDVERLDDDVTRLRLHQGSVAVNLRSRDDAREFELRTEEARYLPTQPGRFRFDHVDDATIVTAWRGALKADGAGAPLTITAGQRVEMWRAAPGEAGNGDNGRYAVSAPEADAFTQWVQAAEDRDDAAAAAPYVSDEMTGREDLDRYGRWEQSPEYGALWTPRDVPVDWAPYSQGQWTFLRPWGWTWVDAAPWGFAPFHYGRWVRHHDNWCWAPGNYVPRPVYAPALVAWVGGPQLSLSLSLGGATREPVGWFPLAPREVYVPWFHASPGYVRNVNVTHVTNITNVVQIVNSPNTVVQQTTYVNRGVGHGLTVVSGSTFIERRPIAGGDRVSPGDRGPRDWKSVPVYSAPPGAPAPVRVALPQVGGRPAPVASPIAHLGSRPDTGAPGGESGRQGGLPIARGNGPQERETVGRGGSNPGDRGDRGDRDGRDARPGAAVMPRQDGGQPGRVGTPIPPSAAATPALPPRFGGREPVDGRDTGHAVPVPPVHAEPRRLPVPAVVPDAREVREARDGRDGRDARDLRDNRDNRDNRDARDNRDGRNARPVEPVQRAPSPALTPRPAAPVPNERPVERLVERPQERPMPVQREERPTPQRPPERPAPTVQPPAVPQAMPPAAPREQRPAPPLPEAPRSPALRTTPSEPAAARTEGRNDGRNAPVRER